MRSPPRIARSVPRARPRPDPRRAARHLAFLRDLPCIACGANPPCQAAHVRKGTDGGIGVKPNDKFALPACPACHARQHQIGEPRFWSALGIDPIDAALKLWSVSGDLEAGNRIIFRARQRIALGRPGLPERVMEQ